LDVVRVSPDGRRHPFAHVPRSLGEQPDLVAAAGRVYLAYTSRVLRVLPSGSVRTVLSGWQVLGESERGMLALLPSRPSGEIGQPLRLHWWFPSWEREPAPVPSAFEAFQVLGWSSDSSAVAALGELDGRPGLWVVPLDRNATPQMVLEGDPEAGFSVGPVAFAADDRFAFFATEDGLFGFDRSLGKLSKLQLPPDLERRVPNGPMVWVP
ncbi:MAG TPA: hypothetical protein VEO00_09505, partial [Actinomycetota bacterium]|nr:hypothetical protein [Actinomycetota bacterium]